ncbi:hypothetical protein chiPu_0011726 [Chiloscyllium punctatum]|uniref:Uncharacterized protein n=1 Tax=Chiloscyllium punctatum TaxID=137246 RepID=A0A401SS94_CHIPU|nr:hypothetical protein [Chiloscyllium punctatum]
MGRLPVCGAGRQTTNQTLLQLDRNQQPRYTQFPVIQDHTGLPSMAGHQMRTALNEPDLILLRPQGKAKFIF